MQKTAFDIVFADDIREDAKTAWLSYFSPKIQDAENIYHLSSIVEYVKRARNGEKVFPENIDIITGGFPCQDFSVAGRRLGFDSKKSYTGDYLSHTESVLENRGHLYFWMREVISLTSPKMFVAENVKGLTTMEDAKEIIEKDFADAGNGGYLIIPSRILFAPDYGVPQSRERVFFFGFRKNALNSEAMEALSSPVIPQKYSPYPVKTHGSGLLPYVTCEDAFAGLEEPENSPDASQQKYSKTKYMGKHCQGQTEIFLGKYSPTIRSEHHGNIEFRRLSTEHGGKHFEELQRGLQERRLTVRECARLQTFPDDYSFVLPKTSEHTAVSASNAYKLIGNAVPCILAYTIAKRLEENWSIWFA